MRGSDFFAARFTVAGQPCALSHHAVERYWQRIRPALPNADAAIPELLHVIATAGRLLSERPEWLPESERERDGKFSMWLAIGDDIVMPLLPGINGRLCATTVLIANGECEHAHDRRDARRRADKRRQRSRRRALEAEGRRSIRHLRHAASRRSSTTSTTRPSRAPSSKLKTLSLSACTTPSKASFLCTPANVTASPRGCSCRPTLSTSSCRLAAW